MSVFVYLYLRVHDCVCICLYVLTSAWLCLNLFICTYECMIVSAFVYMYLRVHDCVCICLYVLTSAWLCLYFFYMYYKCMIVYAFVYMYLRVHDCVCIFYMYLQVHDCVWNILIRITLSLVQGGILNNIVELFCPGMMSVIYDLSSLLLDVSLPSVLCIFRSGISVRQLN